MPRKLSPFAAVLLLVAAACAEPPTPTVDVGSGVRFLPAVADSLNDAGRYPAVVVNEDGRPVVAYFGFEEIPKKDEVVQTRPVGSPSIPGVFLATVSEEGYWTRGAIAIADEIAGAAQLVMGKTDGIPAAVIRGLAVAGDGRGIDLVMPRERDLFR